MSAPGAPAPTPERGRGEAAGETTETGRYLRRVREARDLSKYAVAATTGISHANIFKFEHGQRLPTPEAIAKLGAAYALSKDQRYALLNALARDLRGPYIEALFYRDETAVPA